VIPFWRGLSDEFMAWLDGGSGRRLLKLFAKHDLDVRLRDDSFNAYRAQASVARIEWRSRKRAPQLEIARAYLADTRLLSDGSQGQVFDVSDEFLDSYEQNLPQILKTIDAEYASPEGLWEAKCIQANSSGAPFRIVDRQVVNPGQPSRLDLLAFSTNRERPTALAIELKRDLDNRIQDVPVQLARYLDMLDPDGSGLRSDVAESYFLVCEQLKALGRTAPDPGLVQTNMDVIGVVALANYNPKSELLGRALESAGQLARQIHFCFLNEQGVLPPKSHWFVAVRS